MNNKLPAHATAVDGYVLDGLIEHCGHLIELNYFDELECQKLFTKMIPCLIKKELQFMKERKIIFLKRLSQSDSLIKRFY